MTKPDVSIQVNNNEFVWNQIVKSAINLNEIQTFSSLQKGVEYAVKQNGYALVKK